jgi:transcription initiation factor TFIIIB Brf1 subunit/transcription initiation factor TFIIB
MGQACDECATPLIPLEQSLVCPSCGLLHDQAYQTRTPLPGFKQRLGSLIAMTNSDLRQGVRQNEGFHAQYRRLGDLQESIYRGSYLDVFRLKRDLQNIAEGLLLPQAVVELTMNLFHETTSKVRNPYNSHALLLAVCFIKVTREMGNLAPVKIIEVAEAFAARGYKFSPRLLAKTLYYASNLMPVKKFRSCEECVGKVIQRLGHAAFLRMRADAIDLDMNDYLSRLERLSGDLLESVPPVKRSGRNPFLLAASSVYASSTVISKEKGINSLFTKTEFSREVGIAEYTLRSHLAEIFNKELEKTSCPPMP